MTLVASSDPPSPTSMTARSAGVSLMARKPAAVVLSNTVAWPPVSAMAASTRSRMAFSASSVISVPARRIRSLKRTRWGEV
ncbi:hypothetical protein D9M70_582880 [compost metagenome]